MYNREYTPTRITELKPNEIFVFGSNLAGAHGGGAARLAYRCFGAIWGQGIGLQGQSYAIPTMQGGVETIKPYVDEFIRFAKTRPDLKFYVTQIGCGIAGFKVEEIAPLFQAAIEVENIILPRVFVETIVGIRGLLIQLRKPISNSYMVMDRVYAGEYPREVDDKKSITKLVQFYKFGITHFIDLTEEGELRSYDQMLASPMQHIRFPIQDVSIPANIESVKDLVGKIQGILNESDTNKVYIHCWGGVGRTGTIVGCLLSHLHDFDYEKTMDALKKAFSDCPKSAYRETPETKEQRDFIASYAAEMKQEELGRQALLMWKMGAGNSAKRFNGENPIPEKTKIATKDSWNIEPMPDKHTTIPMDESIPSAAMRIVKYGHIPDAMEDHWYMYCDETTIRYYRSWTGFCIYVAKYEDDGETCRITELTVNREPEQYTCTDDKHDVALFMALLTEEYGGDASKYWQKVF